MTKVDTAKGATQRASAIEQAKIDILTWQSEKLAKNESAELSDDGINNPDDENYSEDAMHIGEWVNYTAGCPEEYYHLYGTNYAYISEYILSKFIKKRTRFYLVKEKSSSINKK